VPRLVRSLPRPVALAIVLCTSVFGVLIYASYLQESYPIRRWLAWRVLGLWGYTAFCNLAWLSSGALIVRRWLGGRELPHLEAAVASVAVGVLAFTEIMYAAGAVGAYGPVFSLALATLLSLSGLPELVRWWRTLREERRAAPASVGTPLLLLWVLGGALTLWLYLGLFSPDAVNYDARWGHFTIPQDYAREGRMVAFPGDYSKNVPQLAALLRTWCFSLPRLGHPVLRWMLALHQEFSLFLWTLAGVAAAVRFMLEDQKVRGAWVAFYLFPIIFVYDHNLGGAADHIAAFFALPGLVAAGRLLERLEWRRASVMVACMAGAFLTKYQAFYWMVPLLAVVAGAWALRLFRLRKAEGAAAERRASWLLLPCIGAGIALLVMPHFLRNWVFYRNPLFPFAQQVFTGTRPSIDQAALLFGNIFVDTNWVPVGSTLERLKHALGLAFTFSFEPHYSFSGNAPVFGSLFTLLLPGLLCIQRRRYVLLGALVGLVTLVFWGFTFNVDRNLQVFMPLLVATTAAILIGILRLGWLARLAIAPLVLLQIIWGADAVFYSSSSRVQGAMALMSSGHDGGAATRFEAYQAPFRQIGKALPENAKVLLHMSHVSLGVDREIVLDWAGFQGLISYNRVHGMRELAELYRSLGITHLLYSPGERSDSSLQGEVAFQALVRWVGKPLAAAGGMRVLRLPKALPPSEPPYRVLTLDMPGYGSGVFPIERLGTIEYLPEKLRAYAAPEAPPPNGAAELAGLDVQAVVVGAAAKLAPAQKALLAKRYDLAARYGGGHSVYLRKAGNPSGS